MILIFSTIHKTLPALLICLVVLAYHQSVIAETEPLEPITVLNGKIEYNKIFAENLNKIELDLKDNDKLKLREDSPEVSLDSMIKLTPEEEELKSALEIQKGQDVEDIKMLWDATVQRNPVIKFALDKISTPPQQRNAKSSMMARTVATMMQGAAILPSLFGMGAMTEYPSALGGQVLSQAFAKKFLPQQDMPAITEPELIQITGIIEELQSQIIKNYYDYKSSLESLMLEQQNTIIQHNNYEKALQSKDPTAIIIASALYDKSIQAELRLKQQVKIRRIQLERMAGIDAVSNLNLTVPEQVLSAKEKLERSLKLPDSHAETAKKEPSLTDNNSNNNKTNNNTKD